MYDFAYQKPGSLADAVKVLAGDMEAKALAGGQTFIPVLKQRLNKPTAVVDLAKLGLSGITVSGNTVTIGAMTTHAAIASSPDIKAKIPGLQHQASLIGDEAVRHRGTMGGSLANNDPAACYPSALLALGGTIKTDRRSIPADDFFQGMFTTALEQGEIITAIELPIPEKSAYEKFRNPASRYAIVGVFVAKFAIWHTACDYGCQPGRCVSPHGDGESAVGELRARCDRRNRHACRWLEWRHPCKCRISSASDWGYRKAGGRKGGLTPFGLAGGR